METEGDGAGHCMWYFYQGIQAIHILFVPWQCFTSPYEEGVRNFSLTLKQNLKMLKIQFLLHHGPGSFCWSVKADTCAWMKHC